MQIDLQKRPTPHLDSEQKAYSIVDRASGEIVGTKFTSADVVSDPDSPTMTVLSALGVCGLTHFYQDGEIKERPAMPVEVQGTTLNLPPHTAFRIEEIPDASGVAGEDGLLQFEFAEPGHYTVRLEQFPYLPKKVTIHAD